MLEDLIEKLNTEAEELQHELNNELPEEIEKAVAQGDISENSEFEAARDRQQLVQAKLQQIARRLSELKEIDEQEVPEDRVGFGSRVTVRDVDDGTEEEFKLAFGDDIDFENSEISMESPIGQALLGKEVGEEVSVRLPNGRVNYEIVDLMTLPQMAEEGKLVDAESEES
ncbi:MAG: GreA/GreB family elongation factor [Candidatus Palauibacterales bacterium]|nr:GreA/GreB family elongation factor [Candidatus Palauibacterales bacterium]